MDRATRFRVLTRDKFTCQYCGKRPPEAVLEVDHIFPKAAGGTDANENLITACFDCNRGKRATIVPRHIGEIPALLWNCADWCPQCLPTTALGFGIAPLMVDFDVNDSVKMTYVGPCHHTWTTYWDRAEALHHGEVIQPFTDKLWRPSKAN